MNKNFFYATAILIGTIVGAGMFGIPYVVAQSGFLIGAIFLLILTAVSLLPVSYTHLTLPTSDLV